MMEEGWWLFEGNACLKLWSRGWMFIWRRMLFGAGVLTQGNTACITVIESHNIAYHLIAISV